MPLDIKSLVADLKKTPKPILVGGAALLAVGGFLIVRGNQPPASHAAPSQTDTTANNPTSLSPFGIVPTSQGVPVLPSNVNPIYGPTGDLVGYQQQPQQQPSPTTPATPNLPPHTVLEPSGVLAYEGALGRGAFLPGYKQFSTEGKLYNVNLPSGAKIVPGDQGRVWMDYQGRSYLLTAGSGNRVTNSTIWQGPNLLTPVSNGTGGGPSVSQFGKSFYAVQHEMDFKRLAQWLEKPYKELCEKNKGRYPTHVQYNLPLPRGSLVAI